MYLYATWIWQKAFYEMRNHVDDSNTKRAPHMDRWVNAISDQFCLRANDSFWLREYNKRVRK